MRIQLYTKKAKLNIFLPTRMLINRFTCKVMLREIYKKILQAAPEGVRIDPRAFENFYQVLRETQKRFPKLVLVDIQSQGERVYIRL